MVPIIMAPSWSSVVEQIAVVSHYEQQQDDTRSSQPHNELVLIPSHEHTQHAHNPAPPIGRKPRPAVLLIPAVLPPPASPLPLPPAPHRRPDQIQARALQQSGALHVRQEGPPRRARQLKIWDLQPELPPGPHLRHDRALEQLRNIPPELPPASQPDAGLPEAPPSDGACCGGAPVRSGLCSPNGDGLCGAVHCARCDLLSRPKRWPSIGFPVRRSEQLAQQAEQAAHPARRINVLAVPSCSCPETRPAGKMAPAYPTGSADPVIPAYPTVSSEPLRQQRPSVPHALPIDEPALFRARTDEFPPPPCAFTSTPADVPLETPRASRNMAEPWGGKTELAQALGSRGLAESAGAALVGGDWRKLPAPGWYRRRDWGIGNERNAIRGVSVRASSGAVAPLPVPPTAQHAAPMMSHAPPTGERAVQSSRSSITRMQSVPTEPERTGDECRAVEADPRSKSHRATCLPINGEAIQIHVASLWLTVLSQLDFLGEVSTAFLGELVPGGRNRQERGEEWSGAQAGSSIDGLSHNHEREQAVGAAAALLTGGSDWERLANAAVDGRRGGATATARLMADPPILSPDMRCCDFSGFNVSGFNTGGPTDAGTCGTTTVDLGDLASPPFNMGSLQPLPMASSLHLGEVLPATPPGQGTTTKNRTEPGRPYLRVRSTLSGQMNDQDTCRKGTGHSPASILEPTLSLGY